MTAARIVLWRHGRTEWNRTNRFQGQADISLDLTGVQQAQAAAPFLEQMEPSVIWSSDLARATHTAQELAVLTGLDVTLDQRLREIHVGSWEGLTGEQVREVDPELSTQLWAGEDVRRSATGETVAEVGQRTAAALADLAVSAEDGSTVVAVTHGVAARAGICELLGYPHAMWHLLGSIDNCCWSVVEWHRGGGFWRIASYNIGATAELNPIS
jgi:broad specificity phosphatase PhoE